MKSILLIPRIAMFLKAMEYYGVKEYQGNNHNPLILKFFSEIGQQWIKDDETAWCSAFMNWIAMKCDCERSGKLDARSWLKVGRDTRMPAQGDIVVFWRESMDSWKGHVGLYVSSNDTEIFCLGGNQNNQINISPYPRYQVLGYKGLNYI